MTISKVRFCRTCGKKIFKRYNVFCDSSCSATHNNKLRRGKKLRVTYSCRVCGAEVSSKGLLCVSCSKISRNALSEATKGELFSRARNWQSARSMIAKHARISFKESRKPKCCVICGYSLFYEVSHIRPVSEFADATRISEINSVSNLVALCPNHHWEFDAGLLSLSQIGDRRSSRLPATTPV